MRLTGALQQREYTKWNAFKIMVGNAQYGPAPYYGEINYTGMMVEKGCYSKPR
ncbi:hypothetical protein [Chitinophaga sancti]|uniref:Uncharacterized protein n=1 Tax=Chitinophaga sancti TaxID=1004 RepID=A0ABZ0XJ39_9BACT|nr:hypothetical protein [Chitinophaga sancti]WQD63929.1 hypothetical protein U0033_05935 [Chitinophaga sancti]WQG90446.1 hypothetical protein SR876_02985 [Chitinophaga sancti]